MTTVIEPTSQMTPPTPAQPLVPKQRKRSPALVWLSSLWLFAIIFAAIFATWLPIGSYDVQVGPPRQAPQFGSIELLLGTDDFGRSILSRCVYGARVSLVVGTVAGLSGLMIGTVFGLIAGYLRRWPDWLVSLMADAMLAFPPLILLLAISSVLTPSITTILIGLTLVTVPTFVRLARANCMNWSAREFVRAAKNMGAGDGRIMVREILPNLVPSLAAYFPTVVAALIVAEGSLSFLGLGIPPPTPSWGGMISGGRSAIGTAPWLVFVPAGAIFLTVFSLNQVGDDLRRRFDRTMAD